MTKAAISMQHNESTDLIDLPEGWRFRLIGGVCKIFGRIGFRGYTVNDIVAEGQGAISLSPSNIKGDRLALARNTFISWEKWEESPEIKIENGDIILVKTGSTVGKAAIVRGLSVPATLNPQMVTFKRRQIDDTFLGYVVTSEDFQSQLSATAVGGALPTLSQKEIAGYRFACPDDPKEQQAIAEALSDADGLIEGLERLIAKKRLIKQGAMQGLLSAKRRLPGFSGEWEMRRLGEVARIATGSRNNQDKDPMGDFPFFVRSDNIERIRTWSLDCEAILIPGEGRIGEIFHYINGKFDVHQRVYCVSDFSDDVSGRFVHTVLKQFFGKHAMTNTVKATVDSLRRPTFTEFSFSCPPTLKEQIAISEVLTDMEAEIQALETRLVKARQVKQGMMQNLLTGRIRLV